MKHLVMTEEKWAEALHDATVNVANGMMSGPVFKRIRAAMTEVDLDAVVVDWLENHTNVEASGDIEPDCKPSDILLARIREAK